ncbi:MAG TPA: hypothetical protein VFC19_54490 [Candidatus Limnocylindrales bacterium]|nr:hypothetical protein [Candidatus Limnocylindrales bacterium]
MPKLSETTLVAAYGNPKVTWGQNTGLQKHKPLLVFIKVAPGMHLTIIPDDAWCFRQMLHEASDAYDKDDNKLHTTYDDLTFDEFHVTDEGMGSAYFTTDGKLTLNDSNDAVAVGRLIGRTHLGWV